MQPIHAGKTLPAVAGDWNEAVGPLKFVRLGNGGAHGLEEAIVPRAPRVSAEPRAYEQTL